MKFDWIETNQICYRFESKLRYTSNQISASIRWISLVLLLNPLKQFKFIVSCRFNSYGLRSSKRYIPKLHRSNYASQSKKSEKNPFRWLCASERKERARETSVDMCIIYMLPHVSCIVIVVSLAIRRLFSKLDFGIESVFVIFICAVWRTSSSRICLRVADTPIYRPIHGLVMEI